MFAGKEVPAVGCSIGVERCFTILEAQLRAKAATSGGRIRDTRTQVCMWALNPIVC